MNIVKRYSAIRTAGCIGLMAFLPSFGNSQALHTGSKGVETTAHQSRSVPAEVKFARPYPQLPPGIIPRSDPNSGPGKPGFRINNTIEVTNTSNSGNGSLRKAIDSANGLGGTNAITFNIPGGGVHTISPTSTLSAITSPIIIDGTTQPGYSGTPLIELNGSLAGVSVNGLTIYAGNSVVRGLAINNFIASGLFNGMGIYMDFNGGNKVEGCFIGTDPTGTIIRRNGGVGVGIFDASGGNIIGGTTALAGNVLSGNGLHGVQVSPGSAGRNVIRGNFLGVNATGTAALGNGQTGVAIFGAVSGDTIGGTAPGARNIISGDSLEGIYITTNLSSTGTVIQGNYIGTNANGNARIPNVYEGIYVDGAPRNTIGGAVFEARNVISGNGDAGVYIYNTPATGNTVQGNYIGTAANGSDTLGNTFGVFLDHAPNDTIGLPVANGGNLISGNYFAGVYIYSPSSTGNVVQNNLIGTDITGSLDKGNLRHGVVLDSASNNVIGGNLPQTANVISGNDSSGITIVGGTATGNKVAGNFIGTRFGGTVALANLNGIVVDNAPKNTIGGLTAAERNVISGNSTYGIETRNAGATGNTIIGNVIGTDASGAVALGNGSHGIRIGSSQDTIGGIGASAGNIIAFNRAKGIYDTTGTGNMFRHNSIYSNSGLGIDLYSVGFTRNDSLDGDTGANDLQNFPILDSSTVSGGTITIHGRLDSKRNTTYTLDFYTNDSCDASHFGEGKTWIASTSVTCNDSGRARFNFPIVMVIPPSNFITATATDSLGSTSEFSQCLCLSDSDKDGILDSWETAGWGIDVNSDSLIDLDLYALGARPRHKDLFVEVDAMTGMGPKDTTLARVAAAYAAVSNTLVNNPDGINGINLHITISDTSITRAAWPVNEWTSFHQIKDSLFGTQAERASPNARYILEAKKLVSRYCIFADNFGGSSGEAESTFAQGCNDFMVTLGGWPVDGGTPDQKAGTFMHELGHTLGLHHGGQDDINYKPNFISIMSYSWQTPFRWTNNWRLNYSTTALPQLIESNLNEPAGLSPPVGAYPIIAVPFRDSVGNIHWGRLKPATAVDWTGNRDSTSASVSVDINHLRLDQAASPGETLKSYVDWSNLIYNFRNSPAFHDAPVGGTSPLALEPEMTPQVFEQLDAFPPPKPVGQFIMDGQVDTSAVLLTSNGGINLYGAVRGSQLYLATNSAQSQGADMFIFVAVVPGALQSAPWLKAGQVAAWTAFLANESTNNSASWYDASASALTSITVDSAGSSILEGVVDLELLAGGSPGSVYVAVGKYQTNDGGALLAQAPAGNGNGTIEANEFYQMNTSLPIQLASFTATPLSGGHVRLQWTTASEVNNYGFEAQRKRNGASEFQTVPNSFVPGHGTTNEPHSYSWTDTSAAAGQWWYRLKQLDLDGTVHYGPEVVIDVLTGVDDNSLPKIFALYQNYPNPFNPSTTFRYDVPNLAHVGLKVYNVLGQEVATLVNETKSAGRYRIEWNASGFASGVYYYRLQAGDYSATKKLILLR